MPSQRPSGSPYHLAPIDSRTEGNCTVSLVLPERGTTAESPTHAAMKQKELCTRAPPKRAKRAFALLTKTYNGSRVTGQMGLPKSWHLITDRKHPCRAGGVTLRVLQGWNFFCIVGGQSFASLVSLTSLR